ncbi:hypothetical protein [Acrocarpospora sp. B8E8]|uniref:hypothetical protein n=1 Tax=Acrocarpospora sp. B8E8 TaxID=3153572 RepID=UPI00325F27AB
MGDVVMDRLLSEAQREFPDWTFSRHDDGWTAQRDGDDYTASSLAALRATLRTIPAQVAPPGHVVWRTWESDRGRHWASRSIPFTKEQADAGAHRTVDADTAEELQAVISQQELIAETAS